ncbi:hypothetical protein [Clostridium hydrogeniformans]|uniref:hypothetical protein n=1 Tax=Clostridium hydrogeniformans TaxID=349933 RepID=UPI0004816A69|nr:hypothetical protein [Clostridium hydrogeniformans]
MRKIKGFILLDCIVAISIFLILSLATIKAVISDYTIRELKKAISEKASVMEAIKYEIRYNTSLKDLEPYYNKKAYVYNEDINIKDIKNNRIMNLIKSEERKEKGDISLYFNKKIENNLPMIFIEYEINIRGFFLRGQWIKGV